MAEAPGFSNRRDAEVRMPKATRVKNKAPAPVQIAAEQILRESKALRESEHVAPRQKITDADELAEYRVRRRKEFEELIRRNRTNMSVWAKYASWEESQKDFPRARSVWERALATDYRHMPSWTRYAEMEMRNRNVNHARNVWDRAVTLLPRVDQLWYKYIHMEEVLGNVAGARQIFERWVAWEPDHNGWLAYIKMELRYGEVDRARVIYERYVAALPSVRAWIHYAKFETRCGETDKARSCYERALAELGEDGATEELFTAFAEFEERCRETERARAIYKYALDHLPKSAAQSLYQRFVAFEKQHGDRAGIEDVIVSRRRFEYEEEIRANPANYDVWFDYARLEESNGDKDKVREVYERAIANIPPADEKRYWQRYIYLWINYALYEELEAKDMERTRDVYRECLKLIPHAKFSFSKLWLLAAQFELRQLNLPGARQILGRAIGLAPKDKIFKAYIDMELQLGNIDRCRKLYERFLEWDPSSCYAWSKYAELERSLAETERGRAVFELAIAQPVLDLPELLWKAYIDFEVAVGEWQRARDLYERLLDRTKHVKVWISYGQFEASVPLPAEQEQEEEDEQAARVAADAAVSDGDGREAGASGPRANGEAGDGHGGEVVALEREDLVLLQRAQRAERARAVFERGLRALKENNPDGKEERVLLLEAWRQMEREQGTEASLASVEKKMPRRVKRKKPILSDEGATIGYEEVFDYIFPEEAGAAPNLKILEAAYRWKRQRLQEGGE